jgi:flotillin
MGLLILVGVVLVALVLVVALVRMMYRVAEPNEALIVSGFGARRPSSSDVVETSSLGFKIVVGKGVFVLPVVQTVRRLGLELHKAELTVDCVTTQGIPVHVRGVVVYKVGDDFESIANAARRFLERESEMDSNVHEVFAGHLRQIVGSLTVEDMIRAREKLAQETRNSSAVEMQKLGLVIDSLQIQEVHDPTGYIENLAKPHQAAVEADARIAAAERNREATEREQAAAARAAKAVSDSEIEQAKLRAAADQEKERASQAGPFAQAEARKAVVIQETEVADLEAARTEKRLQTDVVKPAQAERDAQVARAEAERQQIELRARAEATRVRTQAEADAEATKLRGLAEAEATKARGEADAAAIAAKLTAEADGIQKRAEALAENQEAVINQQIAEELPEIVRAATGAFQSVDHMVVLNGAQGVNGILNEVMGAGISAISLFSDLLGRDGRRAGRREGTRATPADSAEPPRD